MLGRGPQLGVHWQIRTAIRHPDQSGIRSRMKRDPTDIGG
jgi:hypothetical protein